ncbi:MAG: hypothetical protein C0597_16800 [Marinilabiliales bacterium]|nr:MAG: hypothetical protein C0597_16800 [Marinilabiliales bacterium]
MKTRIRILTLAALFISSSALLSSCEEDSEAAQVMSIAVKTAPAKVDYYDDESLELEGLSVTLTMDNGETQDVALSDFAGTGITCSPANGSDLSAELTAVTITHTASGKNTNQAITVKPVVVTGMAVKTPPGKTEYYAQELCDLSGLELSLTMNNGKTEDVAFVDFSSKEIVCLPANGAVLTTELTSLSLKHTPSNITVSQDVIVRELSAISIKSVPVLLDYYKTEVLDLT